jgi:hypothetical protein
LFNFNLQEELLNKIKKLEEENKILKDKLKKILDILNS